MKTLGEDRRLTLRWANRCHNALGNFLHAPTLYQIETGNLPNHSKARDKAKEVANIVEQGVGDFVIKLIPECGFHSK